jgi:major membrane immunogen (membrane-anchored lipoprotein)
MIRKTYLIMCFAVILLLAACGKKDEEPETIVVGNGGNQINVDSVNAPGGEESNEESDLDIGNEKSDTIVIIIDWDKIIINDSENSNIEEMKDQIIKSGCKKIELQHTDANKETLDEVVDILKDIEKTLGIDINYN